MAKSKTVYKKFRGNVSYPQVYEPDEFRGAKNYKLNLHVDEDTAREIKECGIQLTPKTRAIEGMTHEKHFTFKRPYSREFRDGTTIFCPPEIYDKNDEAIVYYENLDGDRVTQVDEGEEIRRVGKPVLIGNDSLIEIEVEVYETRTMGKGNRLRRIKIIDLIEYEPEEEVDPDEDEAREAYGYQEVSPNDQKDTENPKPEPKKAASKESGSKKSSRATVDW